MEIRTRALSPQEQFQAAIVAEVGIIGPLRFVQAMKVVTDSARANDGLTKLSADLQDIGVIKAAELVETGRAFTPGMYRAAMLNLLYQTDKTNWDQLFPPKAQTESPQQ